MNYSEIDQNAPVNQDGTQQDADSPREDAGATSDASAPPAASKAPMSELKLFLTTFVTILIAELGDKTQLTTLLMSAESQAPLTVFLGAGAALILTTLLGVWVGRWLSSRVSVDTLETITGAILAFISLLLLWDVVNL